MAEQRIKYGATRLEAGPRGFGSDVKALAAQFLDDLIEMYSRREGTEDAFGTMVFDIRVAGFRDKQGITICWTDEGKYYVPFKMDVK
jgi:uncharacterized protein YheU (UPF0270 family)